MIGWRPLLLMAVAAALIVAAFLDVGNAAACSDAKRLLRYKQYTGARTAYVKLLDDDSTAKCAEDGLEAVAGKQCEGAKALAAAGREAEAKKAFAAIATSEPVPGVAACPDTLGPTPLATCDAAARLRERGEIKKARDAFISLLVIPAKTRCAQRGLAIVGQDQCDAAKALMEAGQREAAVKALLAIVTTEPVDRSASDCALDTLRSEAR